MNEQELKVTCIQLAISSVGGVASSFGFKGEDGKKHTLKLPKISMTGLREIRINNFNSGWCCTRYLTYRDNRITTRRVHTERRY